MLWKKEANLKYTDLCIYIDENVPNILVPGEHPDIEDKVYNYLWLLVKALAIKKCMFNNFQDYDPYSFYAANRLYFALIKSRNNEGKTIKGKLIRPIKSCLNYTKKLLYPMKIEYQRESYKEVISEEFVSKKFDAFSYKEQMKSDALYAQPSTGIFWIYLESSLAHCDTLIDKVLIKSPFNKTSVEYNRLKISLILNCLANIKLKNKLILSAPTIILWKLPKSMSSYVKVLLNELFSEIKLEIMDCYKSVELDDASLEKIIAEGDGGNTNNYEEQY